MISCQIVWHSPRCWLSGDAVNTALNAWKRHCSCTTTVVLDYTCCIIKLKQTATYQKWETRLRDKRVKTLIAARLMRLAEGLPGDVEPVGEGVSELRIHYGPGYRIYFQRRGNFLIVLLCGGNKSSQSRDIATAKKLAKEWGEQYD